MSFSPEAPLQPPTRTKTPHKNDVLCGRGGTINSHPGNEQYRTFVERKKRVYLTARFKREKRLIAQSIVDEIRKLDPPGRFLTKEASGDFWYDVGDEKARDKTSQALRENSMSVRKQMEEEFNETRRQQAREVAIAAGRDPEKAAEEVSSKPHAEPPVTGGLQPPQSGGFGLVGRSGYGPMYDAQQPALYPPQYDYSLTAQYQCTQTLHSALYPPQLSYYDRQNQHNRASYPYGYALNPYSQAMLPPAYDPNISSNSHYAHDGEPPPTSTSPHVDSQVMHKGDLKSDVHHIGSVPPMMSDSYHPGAPQHLEYGTPQYHKYDHLQRQDDVTNDSKRDASKESSFDRHVQFQPTEQDETHQPPQPSALDNQRADVPLVIGAKMRSPTRSQSRSQSYHLDQSSLLESSPHHQGFSSSNLSPSQSDQYADETRTLSSPKTSKSSEISHADVMSQSTPLTFMSNPLSLKTEDSFAKYLQSIEDEIVGDVGQEVELVAHAPMLNKQEQEQETEVLRYDRHPQGSLSGRSASRRGTPPRHHKSSSRRKRKHHVAGHIPSNSGKVQLDLSAAAFDGSKATPSKATSNEEHCPHVALSCGGMLSAPSSNLNRKQNQATSPIYPLSPSSLDFDKMSLCGTDNISYGGSLLGGASLMNVFEEHGSPVKANALMDMSVSLGSGPSSTSSLAPARVLGIQQAGQQEQFNDHDSMMGASALMDLSVGSTSQSKSSTANESKTHSHSSGSSSGRNRRSFSFASIDKRYVEGETNENVAQDQTHGWTWDGKSNE